MLLFAFIRTVSTYENIFSAADQMLWKGHATQILIQYHPFDFNNYFVTPFKHDMEFYNIYLTMFLP